MKYLFFIRNFLSWNTTSMCSQKNDNTTAYTTSKRVMYIMLLTSILWLPNKLNAQVNTYTFSQSTSSYTPLASPTTLFTTGWDDNVGSVTIPFSFSFNGSTYTSCSVNSNGYITFGSTTSSTTSYVPISATTAYAGAVSAFGRDLINNSTAITYGTQGTSPNRIFIVQWNNARRYNGGAVAGDVFELPNSFV